MRSVYQAQPHTSSLPVFSWLLEIKKELATGEVLPVHGASSAIASGSARVKGKYISTSYSVDREPLFAFLHSLVDTFLLRAHSTQSRSGISFPLVTFTFLRNLAKDRGH